MAHVCPACNGMRRTQRKAQRTWMQRILMRQSIIDELCARCGGVGVIKGSRDEEEELERCRQDKIEEPQRQRTAQDRPKLRRQVRQLVSDMGLASSNHDSSRLHDLEVIAKGMGDAAVDPLVQIVYDEPGLIWTVRWLRWLRDKRGYGALLWIVTNKFVDVRRQPSLPTIQEAILALGELGDPNAISHLKELVTSRQVGQDALGALRLLQADLDPYQEPDVAVVTLDRDTLVSMGPRVVPSLLKFPREYAETLEILGAIGDSRAVGPLVERLWGNTGGNWTSLGLVAKALGKIGDPSALDALLKYLLEGHFAYELSATLTESIRQIIIKSGPTVLRSMLERIATLPRQIEVSYADFERVSKYVDVTEIIDLANKKLGRIRACDRDRYRSVPSLSPFPLKYEKDSRRRITRCARLRENVMTPIVGRL